MTTSEPDPHKAPLTSTGTTDEGRHRATVRTFTPRWRMSPLTRERMETLLPRYGVPDGPFGATAAFGRELPVVLEIGSGHGEAAIAYASEHPEHGIIAAEVHVPGVARMMAAAVEAGVDNLRVFRGDAIEYLTRRVAHGQLDAVHLFFPDPWPKLKHAKRRFVQQDTLDLVLDRIRPGGHLLIATDHLVHAEHVRAQLRAHGDLEWTEGERPDWRPTAGFEDKGARAGRDIHEFRVVAKGETSERATGIEPA